jgi:hypothetical protein
MLAGHYDAACNGDPTATAACLRIIEMRGRMLGFFDNERRARLLNLNITDGASGGDAPREMSIQFVLPGNRVVNLEDFEHQPSQTFQPQGQPQGQPPPRRIQPHPDDVVIERADWQPSAWAKKRGPIAAVLILQGFLEDKS